MITINNNIDSNIRAKIYYKDKFIGECLNELSFLDMRVQIMEENDANYSFELIKTDLESGVDEVSDRIPIKSNGHVPWNKISKLFWSGYEIALSKITGF